MWKIRIDEDQPLLGTLGESNSQLCTFTRQTTCETMAPSCPSQKNHNMLTALFDLLAISLYLIAGILLVRRLFNIPTTVGSELYIKWAVLSLAAGAATLHGALLYSTLWVSDGLNLGLNSAASLMAWAIVVLFLIIAVFKAVENLGVIILPTAALAVLLAWLWPGQHLLLPQVSAVLLSHLVVAFLAYSLLALALVQALVLWWQERRLHQQHSGRALRTMPPIQTMEKFLFGLIGTGFVLLTLTLISGTLFSEAIFGKPLIISHHIVLSLIGWGIFAILLFGHWRFGWRGRHAVRWTVGGFALLLLGYFGSKFVLEILLNR
ncbi:MAG TPA: hypothetical protein ENI80_09885 [Acidiferrobacteraceae bacterium]|nr:hypothetical protein [Acidiferrobacteraceae bacterium]